MQTRRQMLAGGAAAVAATAGVPLPARAQGEVDAYALWQAAIFGTSSERRTALAAIRDRGLPDMAAGLIVAMRFTSLGEREAQPVLEAITGTQAPRDWFDWMLWQEGSPGTVPHPDYARFTRDLHLRIDPAFSDFLRPEFLRRDRARIRIEEIVWGGVVKDGIPSLDNPALIAADEADWLRGDDLVFGVAVGGDARAYPLRIMGWHEMFNDVIGGVPLALAYCTLCGSGILFETKVRGRARPFVFGSSGFLYRSNKLMFDRQTHTLWNQFTGQPVVGPLADSGIELVQRPVVIAPWADWRAANPGTRVLSLETGHRRDYGSGVVYRSYFASPDLMFPARSDTRRLARKDYVFGIRRFGAAKAWPVDAFRRRPVINDAVGDLAVVVIGDTEGRTARAYERGGLSFVQKGGALIDGQGRRWTMGEEALTTEGAAALPRVAGHVAYWFAWDGYLGEAADLYQP